MRYAQTRSQAQLWFLWVTVQCHQHLPIWWNSLATYYRQACCVGPVDFPNCIGCWFGTGAYRDAKNMSHCSSCSTNGKPSCSTWWGPPWMLLWYLQCLVMWPCWWHQLASWLVICNSSQGIHPVHVWNTYCFQHSPSSQLLWYLL